MSAEVDKQLRYARDREHILVGIVKAQDDWKSTLGCIAVAADDKAAVSAVVSHLGLDDVQARAVLDMQFRRLSEENRARLRSELTALREEIGMLSRID